MYDLLKIKLFSDLSQDELNLLKKHCERVVYPEGYQFINEGEREETFFCIISGNVAVMKNAGSMMHNLAHLGPGECIGELALVDDVPRSSSAVCKTDCELLKFDIESLKKEPEFNSIYTKISPMVHEKIMHRLRSTNIVTANALKDKYQMSIFFIRILITLNLYTLSLHIIEKSKAYVSSTTLLSVGIIIAWTAVIISIIHSSNNPYSFYGVSTKDAKKHIKEAVLLTIPIMILFTTFKWIVIHNIHDFQQFPLFDHTACFKKGELFSWTKYFVYMLLYSLFCPIQEFLVRGCFQTSMQKMIEANEGWPLWKVIIISNLIFASSHMHTSMGFALSAFVPGLFWGWLYARQMTLVGVSVSRS